MERQEKNREADGEAKQRRGLAALARQRRLHASSAAAFVHNGRKSPRRRKQKEEEEGGGVGGEGVSGLKIDHSWAD